MWLIAGMIAGSVANALIYRLPRGMAWVKGRSVCPECKHALGMWDLIPIVSFLMLCGKCRYCHSPIPYRYLLVEIFLGVGCAYLAPNYLAMGILWCMTVIAVMDWETMLVHDGMVMLWGMVVFLSHLGHLGDLSYLWGAVTGVGVIGGIWALTRGKGMGSGDIGIAAVMGLMLGWPKIWVGLWWAVILGAAFGLWQLAFRNKKMKSEIAFGPFLIIGTLIAYTVKNVFLF